MPNQNTIFQLKIRYKTAKEEKPSRERSKNSKSLSPTKEMNNHSCYISRASQQSLQPNLSQHTYIKKIVLRVWLQSDWRLLKKMQKFQLLFSPSFYILNTISNKVIDGAAAEKHC